MDYQRIYTAFIADRRTKETALVTSGDYLEKHHILPRALGGGDAPANLICLTPEDHFFAHLLLAKIYGGKMWLAVVLMTASHARCYGESRRLHGFAARAAQRNKAPCERTKAKMLATQQQKAKRYAFVNLGTDEEFVGTTLELQRWAGISQSSASKIATERARTAQGWALSKNRRIPVGKRDLTIRIFRHDDGQVFEGTCYELRTRFNLNPATISGMVKGTKSRNSAKGWRYAGEKTA